MPKQGSPRKTKPSDGSAASRRRNTPVPSFHPAEAPPGSAPPHDELAARAYALFLTRGGQHGDDWRDWFQAEAELRRAQLVDRASSLQSRG